MDITISDEEVNGQELIGISNGMLENIIDNGNTKTFQWRHRYPIVTYYVMAAISNYVWFEEQFNGNGGESYPLIYYVFQEDLNSAQNGVSDLPEAIQFFSDIFGEYPFSNEKYGMTQLGFYGAIENQTNTIQNNLSSNWFYTTVHELGHMWFGDMITCADWHQGWLNEGFATYSEALWDEHNNGFEAYKSHMLSNEFWGGGTLYLENAADTFNTFQNIFYKKGAYVVHMLRGVCGDEVFFDALMDYSQHPDLMYGNASTEDLQEVFETSTDTEFDSFFDQWVYDEYWPFYHYDFIQDDDNKLLVMIHQVQEELYGYRPVFEMPIRIRINYSDNSDTTVTVWNDEQTQQYEFELNKEISSIDIDPDKWILRKTQYNPELPVSIQSSNFNEDISIYPNPFTSELTINFNKISSQDIKIQILNSEGKQIQTFKNVKSKVVRWDGNTTEGIKAKPGIYFVKIKTGYQEIINKVVLKD